MAVHMAARNVLGSAKRSPRKTRKRVSPAKRRMNRLVSDKIPVLLKEGMPKRQAIATSISMAKAGRLRPGGIYVPASKGK